MTAKVCGVGYPLGGARRRTARCVLDRGHAGLHRADDKFGEFTDGGTIPAPDGYHARLYADALDAVQELRSALTRAYPGGYSDAAGDTFSLVDQIENFVNANQGF